MKLDFKFTGSSGTRACSIALGCLSLLACGDDKESAGATLGAKYVLASGVSTDEGSTTYVTLLDSLDAQEGEVDFSKAREFAGWCDMRVIGDAVYVSRDEDPVVERFSVEDGALVADGTIGFDQYSTTAQFYSQIVVSPTKSYLFTESKTHVVWNPTTMEITGTFTLPDQELREGIAPSVGYDRAAIVRGNRVFAAVNWTDYENFILTPTSRIMVIDTDTDQVLNTFEVPCPNLDGVTSDEAGNLYFSNWVYSPGGTLVNQGAKACAVKIPAGQEQIDPAWTLTFADITGGHEGAALRYMGDGKALISVFYEDKKPYDPNVDEIFNWVFSDSWKFWMLDLETRTATPVETLGWHAGGYYESLIDNEMFLLVPGAGYATTDIYLLKGDASNEHRLKLRGWSTRLFPL
jgi:hypothetical protein